MSTRWIEVIVGLFILLGILGLVNLAVKVSGLEDFGQGKNYIVLADFSDIGNLKLGAPVRMAGVTVGRVAGIALDPSTFQARVTMGIQDAFNNIPSDSAASIYTQGILGSNYISLDAGFASTSLKDGSVIATTHSALILEQLIGQLLYQFKNKAST